MSIHRLSAKRDANEAEIVAALRAAGCLVQRISGDGVPDLLVWSAGRHLLLLEVKDGSRPASHPRRKLTPSQQVFHDTWSKAGAPVFKVESIEEALRAVMPLQC